VDETSCAGGTAHECLTAGHRHPNANPTAAVGFPIPIEADFCADVESPINLGDIECHLPGTLNRTGAAPSHQYELVFTHAGSKCEQNNSFSLNGTVRTATESGIEIIP
jgi:hypothetical protein